jgi:serine/threonine protein kinase, bacterial
MTLYCTQGHDNPSDNRFCRFCGELLKSATPEQLGGEVLALRYRIVRELGHGGFGRTYLAADTNRFSESCVLKEFAPQVEGTQGLQKAEELFAREAGVLYQLQHPQIPKFRELFRAEVQGRGRLFLVQDYVEGQTYEEILRSRQRQGQYFTEPEILQLLHQLLPVLSYIHTRGMVHRDISPDNLILRSSDGLPVLIDFGGVKQIAATVASQVAAYGNQPSVNSNVTRLGKVGYAPPEQMDTGEAVAHSDLYALAVTVLVLLTGKDPQELLKDDRRQWQKQVKLGRSLVNVLDRMLSSHPNKRYGSAAEVLRALGTPPKSIVAVPVPVLATGASAMNTIALSPAAPVPRPDLQPSRPAPVQVLHPVPIQPSPSSPRPPRDLSWLPLVLMLGLTGASIYGLFAVNRMTIQPFWQWKPISLLQPKAESTNRIDPNLPRSEPERKQVISDRRRQLGIDEGFLIGLVDESFFLKHPIARPLTKKPEDAALRTDWDKLAMQLLNTMDTLSPEARSRLGTYSEADVEKRRAAVNQLNLGGRALNDLSDARFYALFPNVSPAELLQRPIGQVWQAIATDQVKLLQSGSTLERVQFAPGSTSKQVSGTLKLGEGKAYLADLREAQTLRLKLQSPQKLALSIYPPLRKAPALLEDSGATEWSGKLADSGLYEIVVVSNRPNSVNYTIDLTATNP